MIRRRPLLAAGAALLPGLAARAQGFPTRPVTVLVPFVAGGPSDIVARAIALKLGQTLGQPVVAENRPGANGAVAARLLQRAAPDGHTLLVGSIGVFAINQALRPDVGYDALTDFEPLMLAVTTPNVLAVHPSVPAKTVAELVAWLKANPGKMSYSTSGVGSSDHLTMELFKLRTGTDIIHAPYQGGAAAATDLIAGNVQVTFQNMPTVSGHIQGGRIRALAITAEARHPALPDVPTMKEAGIGDFIVTSWQAANAPKGTPEPILEKLNAEMVKAMRAPDVSQRMEQIGFTVEAGTREAYRAFQRAEVARWKQVIDQAGIRPG